jgi:hypothetical protein
MAEYERRGALLERRWAELTDADAAEIATDAGDLVMAHTRHRAEQLASVLLRTANALERAAELADEHA